MLRLKSFSKSVTGESDRSFNSPPVDSVFKTGGIFSIFLLASLSISSDMNVSEAIFLSISSVLSFSNFSLSASGIAVFDNVCLFGVGFLGLNDPDAFFGN